MRVKNISLLITSLLFFCFMHAKYTRLNWGCTCQGGLEAIVGSGQISDDGFVAALSTASLPTCPTSLTSLPLYKDQIISGIAVNNVSPTLIYIAYITVDHHSLDSTLRIANLTNNLVLTEVANTGVLSKGLSHVQWIGGQGNTFYIATEDTYFIHIIPFDIGSLTFGTPFSAEKSPFSMGESVFLYFYTQDSQIYLLQGLSRGVVTYSFQPGSLNQINFTDLSSTFKTITSCSTCQNFLILGGKSKKSHRGIINSYFLTDVGYVTTTTVNPIKIGNSTIVNHVEKCCCPTAHLLLIATDSKVYTYDATTLTPIGQSEEEESFVDCSWCCSNDKFFSVINSSGKGLIFENNTSKLKFLCKLPSVK